MPAGPPPPGTPRPPPPRPPPPLPRPPPCPFWPPWPEEATFCALRIAPKPQVLVRRKLKVNRPGPVQSLIGAVGEPLVPGVPACAKVPQPLIVLMVDPFGLSPVTLNGRSLKMVSPLLSSPVVMLYGLPLCAIRNGL